MFRSVFKPYGLVWTILNHVTDVLFLSLLWCLCSLPILTMGAATTALYDAVAHGMRRGEGGMYRRFFRTFRAELKLSCCVMLMWAPALLFCGFVLTLLTAAGAESTAAALLSGAYRLIMLVPIGAMCWSLIILSRLTYGFRALTATAFQFLLHDPLPSAAIAAVGWVGIWFCTDNLLPFTFVPALIALAWSFLAEPVFGKLGAGLTGEAAEGE